MQVLFEEVITVVGTDADGTELPLLNVEKEVVEETIGFTSGALLVLFTPLGSIFADSM